jgi:hypothetical protein
MSAVRVVIDPTKINPKSGFYERYITESLKAITNLRAAKNRNWEKILLNYLRFCYVYT